MIFPARIIDMSYKTSFFGRTFFYLSEFFLIIITELFIDDLEVRQINEEKNEKKY